MKLNREQANPAEWNVGDSIEIVYEQQPSLSTNIGDVRIELTTSANQHYEIYEEGSIGLQHKFKINPKRPRVSLSHYWDHLEQLQNLVTFGIGKPTYPRSIVGTISDPAGDSTKVNIYRPISNVPNDVSVHPNRMLFSGSDLAAQYNYVIKQWYQRSQKLSSVFRLYFGTIFGTEMYSENRFLNLAHAIEAYHRTRWWDRYVTELKHDDVIEGKYGDVYEDLLNVLARDPASTYSELPTDTIENLRDKYNLPNNFISAMRNGTLKHANQVSLGRRLRDILNLHGHLIAGLPYNIDGKERDVVNTRNYFSHWDENIPRASGNCSVELGYGGGMGVLKLG